MADRNEIEAVPEANPDLFKWHAAEVIFIPIMMATGILGNALVLYITHIRWKDTIFSFFIKVLAWLDMSNLVLAMPTLLVMTTNGHTPHFQSLCGFTTFVALFTAVTSACVLVVIAADRFRKLCQRSRSQVNLSLATKLTIACFVFGALLSVPSIFIFDKSTVTYNVHVSPVNISYCFIKHDAELSVLLTWAVLMGLTFMIATASLTVLYGFTICALRRHDQRMSRMSRRPSSVSTSSRTVSKKHTRVFIAVTAVFFLAYFPYFVSVVVLLADPSVEGGMDAVKKAFFDLAKLFPLLSNVSNPIIYSFTSEKFREECKKVFKLRPCMKMLNIRRKGSWTSSHEMSQSQSEES